MASKSGMGNWQCVVWRFPPDVRRTAPLAERDALSVEGELVIRHWELLLTSSPLYSFTSSPVHRIESKISIARAKDAVFDKWEPKFNKCVPIRCDRVPVPWQDEPIPFAVPDAAAK